MSYEGPIDPDSAAALASQGADLALSAVPQAAASAKDAAASADAAAASAADAKAAQAAFGITYRMTGTVFQARTPDGSFGQSADLKGDRGDVGKTPSIQIGTVTVGDFAVTRQAGSPDEAPVLDFSLPRGPGGWSPVLAIAVDGARQVLQIADWSGGSGVKPATGYLGAVGLVSSIANAANLVAGGTVLHTGTPTAGDIAVFGADGDHIQSGGALGAFGKTLLALTTAEAGRRALGFGSLATQDAGAVQISGGTGIFDTLSSRSPIGVGSGGTGASSGGGVALDNVLGIAGAAGGGLLTRTAAGSYNFTATANFATAARKVATAGALTGGGDLAADRTLDVAQGGIDNPRLAQMPAATIKGNAVNAAGAPADLTPAQVRTLLNLAAVATSGAYADLSGRPSLLSPAPAAYQVQSVAYTALAADKGTEIELQGSIALTLGPATAVAGWFLWVRKKDGSGDCTIAPSSGTIAGLASIHMYQENFLIWYDAAASAAAQPPAPVYRTIGRQRGLINMGTTTVPSAVASVAFPTTDPEMRDYAFDFEGISASATDNLVLRVQKSGVYQSGASSYYYGGTRASGNIGALSQSDTSIPLIWQVGAQASSSSHGDASLYGAQAATASQRIVTNGFAFNAGNTYAQSVQGQQVGTAAAITGVQFLCAGGSSITSATIAVRGVRP